MKSKDIQKAVKIKFENGDSPTTIYRDLAGVVSLQTIKLWIKKINNIGSVDSWSFTHSSYKSQYLEGEAAPRSKTRVNKKISC